MAKASGVFAKIVFGFMGVRIKIAVRAFFYTPWEMAVNVSGIVIAVCWCR